MLNELQTWWQDTTPETRAALWEGGLALAALLGGHVLGALVARSLRARNFDAVLRPSMDPRRPVIALLWQEGPPVASPNPAAGNSPETNSAATVNGTSNR